MTYTIENPTTALKAAFLWLLENGCEESELEPAFINGDADEVWSFADEDESEVITAPCLTVMQAGDSEPITEFSPAGWVVPIVVRLHAPHGATKEWLRGCVDEITRQLHAQYHVREEATPADRTPLAWRLTSAAQEMDDPQPLHVHHTSVAISRQFGVLSEFITAEFELTVVCGMYDPDA